MPAEPPWMRRPACGQSWSTAHDHRHLPPPHALYSSCHAAPPRVRQPLCAVLLKTQSRAKGKWFEV